MNIIFKIEIHLFPNENVYCDTPFFFFLFSYTNNNWCNSGSGWSTTPQNAWNDAYNFYLLHNSLKNNT